MRSRFGNALRIGLSRTGVALIRTSGLLHRRHDLLSDSSLAESELGAQALTARLDMLVADTGSSGLPTAVILADEWVRMFIVTPPRNAVRLKDYQAAAAMRFQALYGEAMNDWQLEADWDTRWPFLACAMPQAMLVALNATAAKHQLTMTQIEPQFVTAWNRWCSVLKSHAWFGLVQGNMLTLGVIGEQRLCAVRAAAIPADAEEQWLYEYIKREALLLSLAVPRRLQLCGALPHHWTVRSNLPLTCEQLETPTLMAHASPQSDAALLAQMGVGR